MEKPAAEIHPELLAQRVAAIEGVERLREAAAGLDAYLVGGVVRDLLLGRDRADIDVVVEGDARALAARLGGDARRHDRFGTLAVRVGTHEFDLASARAETYPHPGALPEVRPASLQEDLVRRDFTINAMAVPLSGEATLIDPHGGLDDLRAGRLRVLHDRSFADDPTRALRAARYAARYGFELDPDTAEPLRTTDLDTVSSDRVDAELRRLAGDEDPRGALELLANWGLLAVDGERLELIDAVAQLLREPPWRELAELQACILAIARGELGRAPELVARPVPERPSAGVEAAHGLSGIELALARAMGAEWLDAYVAEWRLVRPAISGADLLGAGVEQGPSVGLGLRAALAAKLDGEVHGRSEELRLALAVARGEMPS
jgi:tRNA nucleotidyltransferase (CCA-adding enzyme)